MAQQHKIAAMKRLEDPNKFVLLTISEHRMISKDKLKWIDIFEELIKTKLGGVCYTPKA